MSDRRHPDDQLSAFLDDELDEEAALEVSLHVADCDRCLAELEDLRLARAALRNLPPVTPPEQLFDGVADAAAARETAARATRLTSLALLGVIALLAVAFAVGDESGDVVPPVEVVVVDHVARTGGGPVIIPVSQPAR